MNEWMNECPYPRGRGIIKANTCRMCTRRRESRARLGFFIGGGQVWRAEGRERGGVLGKGLQPTSQPASGSGRSLWDPPVGFGDRGTPTPKGYAQFSALGMATPDTILLMWTIMWFLWRMLRIAWTDKVSNDQVLQRANTPRNLLQANPICGSCYEKESVGSRCTDRDDWRQTS